MRVLVNGFGRIGRLIVNLIVKHTDFEIVVNDVISIDKAVYLFSYDTVHQKRQNVRFEGDVLLAEGKRIVFSNILESKDINCQNIDVVVEATGRFRTYDELAFYLQNGASKVILTSSTKDANIPNVVMGVNDEQIVSYSIISNSSCTSNCFATMFNVLNNHYDISHCMFSTVHAATINQHIQDAYHGENRKGRSMLSSIIPTTTGAMYSIEKIFPQFKNKIIGNAYRVPILNGSLIEMMVHTNNQPSVEQVNQLYKSISNQPQFQNILGYTEDDIVSVDVIGSPYSCLIDSKLTQVLDGIIKIVGWYDNEMGYSHRLLDLILKLKKLT